MSIQRWIENQARSVKGRWMVRKNAPLSDRAREVLIRDFIRSHSPKGFGRAYSDPHIVRRVVEALESRGISRPTHEQIFQKLPDIAWGGRE